MLVLCIYMFFLIPISDSIGRQLKIRVYGFFFVGQDVIATYSNSDRNMNKRDIILPPSFCLIIITSGSTWSNLDIIDSNWLDDSLS